MKKNWYKVRVEEADGDTTEFLVENYTIGAALTKAERMYPHGEVISIRKI